MLVSSRETNYFSSQQITKFIESEEALKREYEKLNKKQLSESSLFNEEDEVQQHTTEKITEYANIIFRSIQYEAANDHLSFKIEEKDKGSSSSIYQLPSLKGSLLGYPTITRIISELFLKQLQIRIEFKKSEWVLTWENSNPHVGCKPTYQPTVPRATTQKSFLHSLQESSDFYDITLLVEGKSIQAHKVILAKSPFFKALILGDWKEKNMKEGIPFPEYSYPAFQAMRQYLYEEEVDSSYFDCHLRLIELFKLAEFIQVQPLKEYCIEQFYQRIDAKNFLDIAMMLEILADDHLSKLCRWYIRKNPNYGQGLDLSNFNIVQIIMIYKIGKNFHAPVLIEKSLVQLKGKLGLDEKFTYLCDFIYQTKDKSLRRWLKGILKESGLYEQLQIGKQGDLSKQWQAFETMMLDLTF